MRKIMQYVVATMAAVTMIITPISAEASTKYSDTWNDTYVTQTTVTNSVAVVRRNTDTNKYIGICTYSNSSYDSVAITGYVSSDGKTYKTTIRGTLSNYRQGGDVQTITADTINADARFNARIKCTSGTAVNKGEIYWIG